MNNIEIDESLLEWKAREMAKKDAKKYREGDITKEELINCCEYARLSAAYGDLEAQIIGYYYLHEMENQGIIKNLRVMD